MTMPDFPVHVELWHSCGYDIAGLITVTVYGIPLHLLQPSHMH
jgi:hypothetical protein